MLNSRQASFIGIVLLVVLVLFAMLILNMRNGLSTNLGASTEQGSDSAATGTAQQSTIFALASEIIAGATQTAANEQTATTSAMGTKATPGPSAPVFVNSSAVTQTAQMQTLYAQA